MEQLWNGEDKVEDLRDEEHEHGFTEVSQNTEYCERHSSEVTERISDEHLGWIPVVDLFSL
jgi:hypothetical protein